MSEVANIGVILLFEDELREAAAALVNLTAADFGSQPDDVRARDYNLAIQLAYRALHGVEDTTKSICVVQKPVVKRRRNK